MGHSMEHFEAFVASIASVLGHADRREPFRHYCTGLLLPGERKSVEPMAAQVAPDRVRSKHQSLHHFVADAPWSDAALLGAVREYVLDRVHRRGEVPEAVLIDDTGMPKQGRHSVGVARQYCGQLGKQDNCQVAVSVSLANEHYSLPVGYRLYLPQEWAQDAERRRKAKVPEDVAFATKAQIAIALLRELKEAGALPPLALADAGYGVSGAFRQDLRALGMDYVVGITGSVKVWPPGVEPGSVPAYGGRGRPPVRRVADASQRPVSVKTLAFGLPQTRYRQVTWREGTNAPLRSRFAALRIRCARREGEHAELEPEQWLLIEWPKGASEPEKYFLSTLPAATPVRELVRLAKLRWRIERDYQELKQELGLGQFEGRSWRGFHHHASLCIAAYGFLVAERITAPKKTLYHPVFGEIPALPEDYRPRGSPAPATSSSRFDRDAASGTCRHADHSSR
ncbi:MAG: IS701 family transposase [Pseudomonadales bacterium]|jgi:SRSO17 transposase|nr:IS701 family transposase [Pseudomonadales bacterium]MCP5337000.1 IS701 family transposase [Pseudomonadales bacterium]